MAAIKIDLKTAKLRWVRQDWQKLLENSKKQMISLDMMNLKMRKMSEAKDTTIEVILGIDDENLSKPKEEHISEIESDYDKTIKGIWDIENSSEELIVKAEEFLQGPQITDNSLQPVSTAAAAGPVTEMFRPQSNLKPTYLDKMATHLEVVKFVQGAEVYVKTGFTSSTPPQGIWAYLMPLMHATWSNELEKAGVRDKDLKTALDILVDESQLRNPVHGHRIDFLATKRGG